MHFITYRKNGFVIFLISVISAEAEIFTINITAFGLRPGVPTAKAVGYKSMRLQKWLCSARFVGQDAPGSCHPHLYTRRTVLCAADVHIGPNITQQPCIRY